MIPKVIHYIWIGGELPQHIQDIINANNIFFSDYKIKIWTEKNIPQLNQFAQRAYNERKWAFVSDYLRFYILFHEGGIYLDTDMEVLNPLDDLLNNSFFSGWDRRGVNIYAGIIGAEPDCQYIKKILESYEVIEQNTYPTSPEIMTKCYHKYNNKNELAIFEGSYFYPLLDSEQKTDALLKNAYTNHLWHESWRNYLPLRRFLRRIGVMKIYHAILEKLSLKE